MNTYTESRIHSLLTPTEKSQLKHSGSLGFAVSIAKQQRSGPVFSIFCQSSSKLWQRCTAKLHRMKGDSSLHRYHPPSCGLHGPKRKELRNVFKSITCNFCCHDTAASAPAPGNPNAGGNAWGGTTGTRRGGWGLSWNCPWHNRFTVFKHTQTLAHIFALYKHSVFS